VTVIGKEWVHDFFIEKGELFLIYFKLLKEKGEKIAEGISKVLNKYNARKVLDLCCGIGRIAILLAEKGFEVIGIDISPLYIHFAECEAERRGVRDNVKFIKGDVRELVKYVAEDAPFDAVISVWTSIGYFKEEDDFNVFRQARKLVRENGVLIIADTVCKESFFGRPFRDRDLIEIEDTLIITKSIYDPLTSRIRTKFSYYRFENKDLKLMGETEYDIRVYGINEVISLLAKAGWKVEELFSDFIELKPYKLGKGLNLVARAL